MEREDFEKFVKMLEAAYRLELSNETKCIYFDILKEYQAENVEKAIKTRIANDKKLPSIAGIVEEIKEIIRIKRIPLL
jgi:hypothetical protein